jgi:Na+/glutamate symporter
MTEPGRKSLTINLMDFALAFVLTVLIFIAGAGIITLMGRQAHVFQIPTFVPALIAMTFFMNWRRRKHSG